MILFEQPAFNPHIRSSALLRKSPKRHLCDTSLAVAALGDSYGYEVDAIVQKRNGDYAAFEIKLGVGYIEEAAENLKSFTANIDTARMNLPKSLNIITGTGMSYRRPDEINVISLASLGI